MNFHNTFTINFDILHTTHHKCEESHSVYYDLDSNVGIKKQSAAQADDRLDRKLFTTIFIS